ncbi:coiled-coil domain-containing protein 60-like isoform X2 [Trichomycterus rosablanca]|uniref:coiled-coil domain-containing protein 60-like isoform X2 n=1 Tax=Trichomycterus rosablanca TaxID=2290929 RepID=UPI002F36092B
MSKTLQHCPVLDLGQFLKIKAVHKNPNREPDVWQNFHQRHQTRCGDGEEKRRPEPENVQNSPPRWLQIQNRGDTDALRRHLRRSRKLVSAVKRGCSYYQLLQEQEEQKTERRRKKEERRCGELRPPSSVSDSDTDDEDEMSADGRGSSSLSRRSRKRRSQTPRPFTPVHQSLASDQPQGLPEACVYRQLCCLCWLLESLSLDRSGGFGPVASCWDAKYSGRSRSTLKTQNREKVIQTEWERFISPPKSLRSVFRVARLASSTQKSFTLGVTSSSSMGTASSLGNMSSCDVTVSTEESESTSVIMSEADPPVSKYLQKLLDEVHQSVHKELYGSRLDDSSDPHTVGFMAVRAAVPSQNDTDTEKIESHQPGSSQPERPSESSLSSLRKEAVLDKMKTTFEARAVELRQNLSDALNRSTRCFSATVMGVTLKSGVRGTEDTPGTPYSTHWLSSLISSLTSSDLTHSSRKLQCVLDKLNHFTQEETLRIRPQTFLRVLNTLPPWELCCPDLCVAIEGVLLFLSLYLL